MRNGNAAALNAGVDIQIEVETLSQLAEALAAGASSVLLDNFTPGQMREAVLGRVKDGDVVITMGAGSIGHLAPELAVPVEATP